MKYAARKMWPEKSQTWDYLGEAESIEDFALMYATDKGLSADAEFVVIEKAGADSDIQFFKVARVEPYALIPADPRVESASVSQGPAPEPQSITAVWHAMFSNFMFFGKVSGVAMLFFGTFIGIAYWFGLW